MAVIIALSGTEIDERLTEVPNWALVDGKLHRDLQFADFAEAFGFMTRVAIMADKAGHHPEWFNVYNKVSIDLVSHDAGDDGGISEHDFAFARRVDAMVD